MSAGVWKTKEKAELEIFNWASGAMKISFSHFSSIKSNSIWNFLKWSKLIKYLHLIEKNAPPKYEPSTTSNLITL